MKCSGDDYIAASKKVVDDLHQPLLKMNFPLNNY